MDILIKGITLDDFIQFGGEYAAYLDGTGCAVELPDHGDLVDIDRILDDFAELRDYDFALREYVVIPAERGEE